MPPNRLRHRPTALLLAVALCACTPLAAQVILPGLGGPTSNGGPLDPVIVDAGIFAGSGEQPALLWVTAQIADNFHIYSVTQPSGGPSPTEIVLDASPQVGLGGEIRADPAPETHIDQSIWRGLRIEEHKGEVTWTVPLRLAPDIDLAKLAVRGRLATQACDASSCVPLDLPFTARLTPAGAGPRVAHVASAAAGSPPVALVAAAAADDSTTEGGYRATGTNVVIRGVLEPAQVAPGETAVLKVTAEPDEGWHVYALAASDPQVIGKGKPTLFVLEGATGTNVGRVLVDAAPIEKESDLEGVGVEKYHEGSVTWSVELPVPAAAKHGVYPLTGLIGYQVCSETGCQRPLGARFQVNLQVGGEKRGEGGNAVPLRISEARYAEAARLSKNEAAVSVGSRKVIYPSGDSGASPGGGTGLGGGETGLASMIVFGFLGGILLNLMPCVLPVIGLKIMSFVEQAGQSRREALVLNMWYSLGLLSVFLVLATLAVVAGFAWGEQFGSDLFNIVLATLVFAMALSLLGVWEIPIPGFIGGSASHEISSKEGPLGAFLKGAITTVLATPCTGPFMGTALGWAVQQPPAATFSVFTSIGLGMASPYLLVGAVPTLIRFLPRPGAWMVTFKQVMGFILLGTVIFLLSFIDPPLVVPTITTLAGVAAGCWWFNRTPLTANLPSKVTAFTIGSAFTLLVAFLSFGGPPFGLDHIMRSRLARYVQLHGGKLEVAAVEGEIHWEPFTSARLAALHQEGKTVLVDFTADWCATCKEREANVLNTTEVKEVLEKNGVVTLQADYTKKAPEIKEVLRSLDAGGVPVIAIYPAGNSSQPLVFRGWYSKANLLTALQQAGPSQGQPGGAAATAMLR